MKTFRLSLLAVLVPFLFSCEKDPVAGSLPDPATETDPHKIPVAAALAELDAMLAAIGRHTWVAGGVKNWNREVLITMRIPFHRALKSRESNYTAAISDGRELPTDIICLIDLLCLVRSGL